ncbi:unnamed protein product [marine sediment metagenome]|uniref:Uncharacterized protein n=1 Tax=marine sediment metagenome TaxID=412755 RepID=X0T8F0_9ZZZZ
MLKLTKGQLLERDRRYLERAANVADWERELIEEGLEKGFRLLPDLVDEDHPIFCPVWRLRLHVLQLLRWVKPMDAVRQMIWGLGADVWWFTERYHKPESEEPGTRIYVLDRGGLACWIPIPIPIPWEEEQ